jgi:molybdenum cofactor cytidylyltransferase
MISAIVLAAGLSSRMRRNKLLLTFKNKPLIVHAVDTLLESEIDEIIVVLGHEAEKLREHLAGKPVKLVFNPDYRSGQSTSVRMGVSAVSHAAAILVYLADQPLLEPGDINHLVQTFARAKEIGKSIVVPFYQGQRGNPVILDLSYREAILEVVGDIGCKHVIKRYPDQVLIVEMPTDHVVCDVDTLEEFRDLSSRLEYL